MSAQERVRAAYPSARVESRGLTYVAIRAIERDPVTRRVVADHILGSATGEHAAWADAARRLDDQP